MNDADHARVLESIHQQHRVAVGKLAMQLAVYRQQLEDAGITPKDYPDDDLIRLWRAAANTVSAASSLVVELGSAKELLDPGLITLTLVGNVPGTYKNGKLWTPDAPGEPRPYFGTVGVITGERASYTEFWVTLMRNTSIMGQGVATKVAMGVDVAGNCNTICRSSRERQDDWVWIMGDDHVWDHDLLPRLIEHDVDIVVPNCLKRNPPWMSLVFSRQDENGHYVMAVTDGELPEDELVEIHAAGSGGMLIRGHVLDAIGDPYFRPDPQGVGLNEDLYFCRRAREAGFKIWCDTGALLGHISKYTVWPEYRDGEWQVSMEFDQKHMPVERVFPREEVPA